MTRAWGDLADGFRQARAVAAPGLAGHQAALPPLGARTVLDHDRHRHHGRRDGRRCTPSCSTSNSPMHLPYVTLGLIIWNLINASILEGADVFVANEGLIKQLPTPLSVHVYRLVWRQMILFAHNIVIFVVIAIIFPKPWSWTDLSVIPALAPDRAQLRVGVAVFRHPGHPLPRHQPAAVQPRAAAVLHDADHLERRHAAAAGRRAAGPRSSSSTRCCTTSTSCARRCSAPHQELRHWVVVIGADRRSAGSWPPSRCGSTAPACRTGFNSTALGLIQRRWV